ncbi:MAG: IclR family transcriptional regulator [Roseovarius sp.]
MQSSIIAKLLSVLTAISETQKPMTFSDLVRKTGLNKSTLHRLLAIGIQERLIQHDKHLKAYLLGSKVFDLVRGAYQGYDIQAIALDEMIKLHAQFDANVTIGVASGSEVVYLRVLESQHSLRGVQRPGMREPLHCSASGKALMAFLPDKVIASRLDGYEFTRFTDRTVGSNEAFMDALQQVRADGFAMNDREEFENFIGISAPVFNYLSEPIAVLNIWTDTSRHTLSDLQDWSDSLRQSTERVTGLIGGVAPTLASLRA